MKILQINPYPPESLGGSEIFCKNLSINLNKINNVECDILTSDLLKNGKSIDYLNNGKGKIYYKRCFFNLWNKNPIVNIIKFLKKEHQNYDIIHTHSYIFFTSIQTALIKKFQRFPLILHIHGFKIHPKLTTGFNVYEKLQLKFKDLIFDKYLGKFSIKMADKIISVSKRDLDLIIKNYNVSNENCYYIPNAVNIDKFQFNNQIERKYITFIGRLSYIKGFDIFLKLIQLIHKKDPSIKFLVIGDGPLKDLLEKLRFKIPIKYSPYFPYNKIEEVYNRTKILLISSRFEGVPTILLESLSCQTPVISTNAGGIPEVIKNGVNGYLYNVENLEKAVENICNLYNDHDRLMYMGKNGRELIHNKFSWKKITKSILKIYEELLMNKRNIKY